MKAEPIDLLAALQASINRARGKHAPCDTCDGTGKVHQEGQISAPGSACDLTCPDCQPLPVRVVERDDDTAGGEHG